MLYNNFLVVLYLVSETPYLLVLYTPQFHFLNLLTYQLLVNQSELTPVVCIPDNNRYPGGLLSNKYSFASKYYQEFKPIKSRKTGLEIKREPG